jgi:hypothetical protein
MVGLMIARWYHGVETPLGAESALKIYPIQNKSATYVVTCFVQNVWNFTGNHAKRYERFLVHCANILCFLLNADMCFILPNQNFNLLLRLIFAKHYLSIVLCLQEYVWEIP